MTVHVNATVGVRVNGAVTVHPDAIITTTTIDAITDVIRVAVKICVARISKLIWLD